MSRKPYTPKGKILSSETMRGMREIVYGNKTYFAIKSVLKRADELRDDDALLEAAEAKRLRKQAKRAK